MGLDWIEKVVEHESGIKPSSSAVPASVAVWVWVPALTSLNGGLWLGSTNQINPFLYKCFFFFDMVFIMATETKLEHQSKTRRGRRHEKIILMASVVTGKT